MEKVIRRFTLSLTTGEKVDITVSTLDVRESTIIKQIIEDGFVKCELGKYYLTKHIISIEPIKKSSLDHAKDIIEEYNDKLKNESIIPNIYCNHKNRNGIDATVLVEPSNLPEELKCIDRDLTVCKCKICGLYLVLDLRSDN